MIPNSDFIDALKELNMNYRPNHTLMITERYKEKSSDNLYIKEIIDFFNKSQANDQAYEHIFDSRLPKLDSVEEQELKVLLKEIGDFARSHDYNLNQQFKKIDYDSLGYLPWIEFEKIMQKN